MEKFLKVYGIILLSIVSIALAGLLIVGIILIAPSLSDIASNGSISNLGNGFGFILGVFALVLCSELLALAIPYFFRFGQARKKKYNVVRIIDVFMVAYYSVAMVAGIIWSVADKDSMVLGLVLLGIALIMNTFAIPALVWDKKQKAAKVDNAASSETEETENEESEDEVIYKEI